MWRFLKRAFGSSANARSENESDEPTVKDLSQRDSTRFKELLRLPAFQIENGISFDVAIETHSQSYYGYNAHEMRHQPLTNPREVVPVELSVEQQVLLIMASYGAPTSDWKEPSPDHWKPYRLHYLWSIHNSEGYTRRETSKAAFVVTGSEELALVDKDDPSVAQRYLQAFEGLMPLLTDKMKSAGTLMGSASLNKYERALGIKSGSRFLLNPLGWAVLWGALPPEGRGVLSD